MSDFSLQQNARQVTLDAVIIRADGTREPLGMVAYWHRNPLKRIAHRLLHGKTGKVTF